jgi:hypothetical protein
MRKFNDCFEEVSEEDYGHYHQALEPIIEFAHDVDNIHQLLSPESVKKIAKQHQNLEGQLQEIFGFLAEVDDFVSAAASAAP